MPDKTVYHRAMLEYNGMSDDCSCGEEHDFSSIEDIRHVIRVLCNHEYFKMEHLYYIPTSYKQYILDTLDIDEALEYIKENNIPIDDDYVEYLLDRFTYDNKKKLLDYLDIVDRKSVIEDIIERYVEEDVPKRALKLIAEYR